MSESENSCWICDAPFDESKPSRPYKQEEKEIVVEEAPPKKGGDNVK